MRPNDVTRATLHLRNAPLYRRTWGLGLELGGPALMGSVLGHWYPAEFFVLELGVLPYQGPALVGGWFGARFRLRAATSLFLSAGAAVGGVDQPSKGEEPDHWSYHAMWPRLATEYVLPSRYDVLKLEVQLAYGTLFERPDESWYPWGGIGYVRWF